NLFPAIEVALARWRDMQGLAEELAGLKDSLETRKTLDRAKGIIMAAHHLTEQEAYRRIQRYAMTKRLTVKDVAAAIVRAAGGKV
ncbi:MAG: ANTAR domain-containing protein, partial [Selenomonas sp.]|nr:ANTAR domain-containing protein [Selenomonas sp.]